MNNNPLRRAWNYIWHGEGITSLILSIILVFVIVRYVIYPLGGALVGTPFPVVAVVSGSMEHNGMTASQWWNSPCCLDQLCTRNAPQSSIYAPYNITLEQIETYRFPDGFNKGDIMILTHANNARIGDTIVFFSTRRSEPIIHRLITIDTDTQTYRTKGDNNCAIADFEEHIPGQNVVGKAVARIPFLGYIKIFFVEFLSILGIGAGI